MKRNKMRQRKKNKIGFLFLKTKILNNNSNNEKMKTSWRTKRMTDKEISTKNKGKKVTIVGEENLNPEQEI